MLFKYYKIGLTVLLLMISFGTVGPFAISAFNDEIFYAGILYFIFILPTILYFIWRKQIAVSCTPVKCNLPYGGYADVASKALSGTVGTENSVMKRVHNLRCIAA